jgi:hypothetical protein
MEERQGDEVHFEQELEFLGNITMSARNTLPQQPPSSGFQQHVSTPVPHQALQHDCHSQFQVWERPPSALHSTLHSYAEDSAIGLARTHPGLPVGLAGGGLPVQASAVPGGLPTMTPPPAPGKGVWLLTQGTGCHPKTVVPSAFSLPL